MCGKSDDRVDVVYMCGKSDGRIDVVYMCCKSTGGNRRSINVW